MKSISVIVTYYNSEDYIEKCLTSLKKQRFQDFELILVNDGSTDRNENIVYKYKEIFEERNIRFVYLKQENGGQAKAMQSFAPTRLDLDKAPDSWILCPHQQAPVSKM